MPKRTDSVIGIARMTRLAIIVCGSILALALMEDPIGACVRSFPHYKVRRDFVVSVVGRPAGEPVGGIQVTVYRWTKEPGVSYENVAQMSTDRDGHAAFHGLTSGEYFLGTEHTGVGGGGGELDVDDSSDVTTINLTWPRGPILETRRVAGVLTVDKEHAALAEADLSLEDAVSGKAVGKASTDAAGNFAFPGVGPGLYVLHIKESRGCDHYPYPCRIQGFILVQIDPRAKEAEMPRFGLMMSDCGLGAWEDDGTLEFFGVEPVLAQSRTVS
jgi:hypothetical protein